MVSGEAIVLNAFATLWDMVVAEGLDAQVDVVFLLLCVILRLRFRVLKVIGGMLVMVIIVSKALLCVGSARCVFIEPDC